ncbi:MULTISPECIES: glycoside hydrolase family protein [unclassified Paraburkholderia]|uniref:glycoside hydrolase family protein n=1 Tax=unclassified Paraburkholderia TaxID=2615204 RepID=UPI003905CAEE
MRRTERAINAKVHVPLFQYVYDALVSVSFNAVADHAADELTHRENQVTAEIFRIT